MLSRLVQTDSWRNFWRVPSKVEFLQGLRRFSFRLCVFLFSFIVIAGTLEVISKSLLPSLPSEDPVRGAIGTAFILFWFLFSGSLIVTNLWAMWKDWSPKDYINFVVRVFNF